jgi:hypothetical protein
MRSRKRTDPNRRTALYRFFDAEERLLYVGITVNTKKRWQYHAKEQATTWWPLAARNTVEWLGTRREAEQAERAAIRDESPLYNVMHTERNHRTYGNRRGSISAGGPSPTRGKQMLATIRSHFPEQPFTQLDVLAVVPICRSAVGQNFRALLVRGEVVAVGRRTRSGYPGLGEILYVLPESPLAGSSEPVYQVVPSQRSRAERSERSKSSKSPSGRSWVYGSFPTLPAFRTLEAARDAFGDLPFSRAGLAKLTGLSMPGLIKHVVSLEHHGFIRCIGREPLSGRSGHPPKLYVVTEKEPPTQSQKTPQPRRSVVSDEPSPDDFVNFQQIAALLESGKWGRPILPKRVAELAEQDPDWPVPKEHWSFRGGVPVFPWGLVAAYCTARATRLSQFTGLLGTEPRGFHLYRLARNHFGIQAFTQAELSSVADVTLPGVQQNVRCLVASGLFEQVGTAQATGPGGRSRLYRAVPRQIAPEGSISS